MPYTSRRRYPSRSFRRRSFSGGRPTYKTRGTGRRSFSSKGRYARFRRKGWNPRANSILSLDKYFAKLRFQDNINLTLPQVSFTDYLQYSLNSVYDPYYGVGGGVIKGHAEMSSIWSRYMVMGAAFKLKGAFWSEDPNDTQNWSRPYAAFLQAYDADASPTPATPDIDRLAEQGSECRYHVVVPAAGTQQRLCMIKRYFAVKRVEGASISGNIEQYSSYVQADPPRQCSVLVGITQVDQTGFFNIKFSGQLTVKYYVRYMNRVDNLP